MSYLIDVYRGDASPEKKIIHVAAYISMFPQLIAGPIVRFKDIVAEIRDRVISANDIARGIHLFVIGLAAKVLIANTLAIPADAAFNMPIENLSCSLAWLGIISYTMQIYFDFAGYSMMAIGLGQMLGFHLPINFNHPYTSKSITEFWRRWHISLSTWFRDYLYIPLGGNRKGHGRTYGNLITVFVLCGIWHGANWTFLIWGLYHGLFLVLERMITWLREGTRFAIGRRAYLLVVVAIGWVMFRGSDIGHSGDYVASLLNMGGINPSLSGATEYLTPDVIIALSIAGAITIFGPTLERYWYRLFDMAETFSGFNIGRLILRTAAYLILFILCAGALASGLHNPFIYFSF
jgi:alginate O-acetyltransferase complex protein AlgI